MERVEIFVIFGILVTWVLTLALKIGQEDIKSKLDELLKDKEGEDADS